MKKKFIAIIATMMVTVFAFTGCGNNAATGITVISREDGSGTRSAFVELLGIVDEKENDIITQMAEITNSTSVMLSTVEGNKAAIGYVSMGSLSDNVKTVQVDGVDATAENVKSGDYKVSRPFVIAYKPNELSDIGEDFINFIMSTQGQAIVEEEGFIGFETDGDYGGSGKSGKITLAGSTSVAPVMHVLASTYKEINPDVTVEIQESGSSAGIQSAIEGAVEIGMSSRELKEEEAAELDSLQIALDGIAVIVNKENQVSSLTSEQIKKIYTGKVVDWSEIL